MSRLDAFLNPEDVLALQLAEQKREADRVRTHIKAVIEAVRATAPTDGSPAAHFFSGQLTGLSVAAMILAGVDAERAMEKVAEKATELAEQATADSVPADQALERVQALASEWIRGGGPTLGTSVNRWWDTRLAELLAALNPAREATS